MEILNLFNIFLYFLINGTMSTDIFTNFFPGDIFLHCNHQIKRSALLWFVFTLRSSYIYIYTHTHTEASIISITHFIKTFHFFFLLIDLHISESNCGKKPIKHFNNISVSIQNRIFLY